MSIQNIQAINPALVRQANPPSATEPAAVQGGFAEMLTESVENANEIMAAADAEANNLVTSQGANLHETMIALEKADIALRLTVSIGTKLVRAYEEVSRMQV